MNIIKTYIHNVENDYMIVALINYFKSWRSVFRNGKKQQLISFHISLAILSSHLRELRMILTPFLFVSLSMRDDVFRWGCCCSDILLFSIIMVLISCDNVFPSPFSHLKENNSALSLVLHILICRNLIWKTSPASFPGTTFEVTIGNNKPY